MGYIVGSESIALETATTEYTDLELPVDAKNIYRLDDLEYWIYSSDPSIVAFILGMASVAINRRTSVGVGTMFADDVIARAGTQFFIPPTVEAASPQYIDLFGRDSRVEREGAYFNGDDLRMLWRVLPPGAEASGTFNIYYRISYTPVKMTNALRQELLDRRYNPTA